MVACSVRNARVRSFLQIAAAAAVWIAHSPSALLGHEPTTLVIAHRGASGYLPEHSEGAKVLAFAQGADVLEQDVVLSKDGVLIVSHDVTMDATTNVREIYPERARADGKTYWADFNWSELNRVSMRERSLDSPTSERFRYATESRVMRLDDEIKLIRGLNQVLDRNVGFHIELKAPAWHLKEFGTHMADTLLAVLKEHEVTAASEPCFIQCFELEELKYMKEVLKCELPLVQLLGGRRPASGAAGSKSLEEELAEIAKYANGVGPAIPLLLTSDGDSVKSSGYVEAAHKAGLVVHPYTIRRDMLPAWCANVDDLHRVLIKELKVDGFFTDFPDLGRAAVDSNHSAP